jgi:hypothetical protein
MTTSEPIGRKDVMESKTIVKSHKKSKQRIEFATRGINDLSNEKVALEYSALRVRKYSIIARVFESEYG